MEDFIAILKCSSIHTPYSIMTKANIDFERGLTWKQSQFVYRNLSSSKIWWSCLLNSQKKSKCPTELLHPQSHSAGQSSSYFVDITLLISAIHGDVFVLLAVKETPVLTRVTAATVMMWCANTEGRKWKANRRIEMHGRVCMIAPSCDVRFHSRPSDAKEAGSAFEYWRVYTVQDRVCVCVISAKETLSEASSFYLPTATAPTHAALTNTYKSKSWDSCKLANPGAPF